MVSNQRMLRNVRKCSLLEKPAILSVFSHQSTIDDNPKRGLIFPLEQLEIEIRRNTIFCGCLIFYRRHESLLNGAMHQKS